MADIAPFMISEESNKVVAVRLFRSKRGIWLAGKLLRAELAANKLSIRLNGFIEIMPTTKRDDPDAGLFTSFTQVISDVSDNGYDGRDNRILELASPMRTNHLKHPPGEMLSISSAENGEAILSLTSRDIKEIERLLVSYRPGAKPAQPIL